MNFTEEDIGKEVRNKKTGQIGKYISRCDEPSFNIEFENGHRTGGAINSPLAQEWKIYEEDWHYECDKCHTELTAEIMGKQCPKCGEWTYSHRCLRKRKEDNWNLANNGKPADYKDLGRESIKTFIQKCKEDDNKAKKVVGVGGIPSQYIKGYIDGMNDADYHRTNRAGDL